MNRHYGTCTDCERPLRPRYGTLADWPGTMSAARRNLCASCHNRRRGYNPATRRVVIAACPQCGLERQVNVTRGVNGPCRQCYDQEQPAWPERDIELTDGRWVPNGRGIVVWDKAS